MRGRITHALYQKIQLNDCIAGSAKAYTERAARLGTDREFREQVSQRILKRADVLYEDPAEVHELERFLACAAEGGSGSWTIG